MSGLSESPELLLQGIPAGNQEPTRYQPAGGGPALGLLPFPGQRRVDGPRVPQKRRWRSRAAQRAAPPPAGVSRRAGTRAFAVPRQSSRGSASSAVHLLIARCKDRKPAVPGPSQRGSHAARTRQRGPSPEGPPAAPAALQRSAGSKEPPAARPALRGRRPFRRRQGTGSPPAAALARPARAQCPCPPGAPSFVRRELPQGPDEGGTRPTAPAALTAAAPARAPRWGQLSWTPTASPHAKTRTFSLQLGVWHGAGSPTLSPSAPPFLNLLAASLGGKRWKELAFQQPAAPDQADGRAAQRRGEQGWLHAGQRLAGPAG